MTTLIDGKKIRDRLLSEITADIAGLSFTPVFCDVLVGDDPVSAQYVRMKAKTASSVGIHAHFASFPDAITTEKLIAEIQQLNAYPDMCGLIVQLPLSQHIDTQAVLDAIDPSIDVDCLSTETSNAFYQGQEVLAYPTALACLAVLDSLQLDLTNKHFVVLGQGKLVGKPVSHLLHARGYNVSVIDIKTPDALELLKSADIIISAIGEPGYIKGTMIKNGVIIVDAGTSEETNTVVGDVDRASVEGIAAILSSVPGGVGPVTVAMLLRNVLLAAGQKNKGITQHE
ncbi:MAG: bifunctional 5,10-methylenetetrahydrofolate dehydrogenase/5,10-methenyltetrahydrofolate cyclohydrolase [Candidatus Pacebacteria bacterium]|jgi:methylenetetrahydrofolate dehydrogenase (NADP+)/methenyltetrahydrofolate cyclohydrolase|nr:bifunctional 5,10-methylenetetrahydrofolate dehydrogenase/5,10-methenyltetrahydrofolate cyclohydrolase [Candidatus Paceibacterota bacterium]